MNFHILTLFPEMIEQGLNTSITGRAISNGLLSIEAVNIRDYAFNKHQSVDEKRSLKENRQRQRQKSRQKQNNWKKNR